MRNVDNARTESDSMGPIAHELQGGPRKHLPSQQGEYRGHTVNVDDVARHENSGQREGQRVLLYSLALDLLIRETSFLTDVLRILDGATHLRWVVGAREVFFGSSHRTGTCMEDLFH